VFDTSTTRSKNFRIDAPPPQQEQLPNEYK